MFLALRNRYLRDGDMVAAGTPATETSNPGQAPAGDDQRRWAEMLASLAALLPDRSRCVLVDGPAEQAGLFATRRAGRRSRPGPATPFLPTSRWRRDRCAGPRRPPAGGNRLRRRAAPLLRRGRAPVVPPSVPAPLGTEGGDAGRPQSLAGIGGAQPGRGIRQNGWPAGSA